MVACPVPFTIVGHVAAEPILCDRDALAAAEHHQVEELGVVLHIGEDVGEVPPVGLRVVAEVQT
jgi:hypothetical protein